MHSYSLMSQKQGLNTEIGIRQRITQQQLRYVRLLELTAPQVDEAVERELEENPALEAVPETQEPSQPQQRQNLTGNYFSPARDSSQFVDFSPADTSESLYDSLSLQLSEKNIPEDVRDCADYLIHSIDANGYLRSSLESLQQDMLFHHDIDMPLETIREALDVVRSLDPPGVGASDLKECLLLQLRRMAPSQSRDDAIRIIEKKFDAFLKKHSHKLISGLRISAERVESALALIRSLNPKPGAAFNSSDFESSNIIIPDFIITENEDGKLSIILNNRVPELKIAESFTQAFNSLERNARGRKVKNNEDVVIPYEDARDFIAILKQRQRTMYSIMSAIVKLQLPYFETGDVYKLRPMMIKDLKELTGYDISTISRATANKYVSLPWGVYPLRFFFSDSIGGKKDSDALTNRKIEAEITKIVSEEDKKHPLSDDSISEEMKRRGYEISRRTVAKYRDRCRIPIARLRKS